MAIIFNSKTKTFTLNTATTSYQMQIGEYNVLLHLYYGKNIGEENMEYLLQKQARGFCANPYEAGKDRSFSLDTLMQTYPSTGVGDFRIGCLDILNGDGSFAIDPRYVSHKIYSGKYSIEGLPTVYANEESAQTLEILMRDDVTNVEIVLYFGVLEERNVITRAAKVMNKGKMPIHLRKALSTCIDFPHSEWDLIHFYGRHPMEREMERNKLMHGVQSIGSTRGASSHQHNPFIILADPKTGEDYGECYGFSLLYSGNFIAEVEVDQANQTRIVMGIHNKQFEFILEQEESFSAPEVAMVYTDKGLSELSKTYHETYRNNLCRGIYKNKRRPILINNWEATYFNFNSQKLLNIAKDAAELGIEMLVMDDGWFGKRNDDESSLGDWFVNTDKLGCELKELVAGVNAYGLKFGIWFEPEMVSEESELYSKHPDWCLAMPNRKPSRSRHQLVLDLSRSDVRDYLYESISNILDSANIEYVKWDMNRSICDVHSAIIPTHKQGEVYHRYILGLYELLEKLTSKYPHILFEGCSGGGGRFDAGMLYYTPQIWCSDNTDAIDRLKIQYGTSFGYPISTVGSHVSACPNHQMGRITPFNTRATVAMAGSFGYELDIAHLTEEEKEEVKVQIEAYKKYYEVIHQGDYYRLSNPYESEYHVAWQFVSKDQRESLLNVVQIKARASSPITYIRLKGLNPEKVYYINEDQVGYKGKVLMYAGLPIPILSGDYQAMQFYLKEKEN